MGVQDVEFTTINYIDGIISNFVFWNWIFIKYGITFYMDYGFSLSNYCYIDR